MHNFFLPAPLQKHVAAQKGCALITKSQRAFCLEEVEIVWRTSLVSNWTSKRCWANNRGGVDVGTAL